MRESIVALILAFMLLTLPLAAGELIPDREIGKIKSGGSETFHFTIFNRRNQTIFFVITSPEVDGWTLNVTPSSGVIFPHGEKVVHIQISAPEAYGNAEYTFVFTVMIYNSSGFLEKYEYTLELTLLSHGTFFFFFTLPFPEEWGYWGAFLSVILTWGIISLALYVLFPLITKLTRRTRTKVDDILVEILKKPVAVWVIIYGLLSASLTLPIPPDISLILVKIYNIVVIVIITWIIYRIFRDIIIYYSFDLSKRKGKRDLETVLLPVIEKIGVVTIVTIGGIMLLQEAGVNIAVLVASLGVAGIIIGLAAQDTLGNFFSGLHILLDKAFEIGDLILLEGEDSVYRVQDVGLRSTKLYDIFSHTMIYIPNSLLANHKIINLNRPDTNIKIKVEVSVSYNSDVGKVKEVLREIALSIPEVLKDEKHAPVVIFREFGDSSLNFILYVWVDKVVNQWAVGSRIREEIVRRFREEGIEIPYPQLDVHMK